MGATAPEHTGDGAGKGLGWGGSFLVNRNIGGGEKEIRVVGGGESRWKKKSK